MNNDMSTAALTPQTAPTANAGAGVVSNRRRSERIPQVMAAWICSPTATDPAKERQEVTSLNLSRHGIGFRASRELATGVFCVMEIGIGEQRLVSEVHIVSCRRGDDGRFDVGAEFC